MVPGSHPNLGNLKRGINHAKEGTAANRRRSGLEGYRFKTWCHQWLFTAESLLKISLPLVICVYNTNTWIGWLYICCRCGRCDMSPINKRSTRLEGTLKKGRKIVLNGAGVGEVWLVLHRLDQLLHAERDRLEDSAKDLQGSGLRGQTWER